jgi:2'-5' RNA ligase
MRLFFAVKIPEHAAFSKLYFGLKRISKQLKPVDPERQHVTLKFLGDPGTTIEDVVNAVSGIGSGHGPFEMKVDSSGAFSNWRKPSVLWLGLSPRDGLSSLAGDIDRNLHENIGSGLEKRDFRAHITVARYRSSQPFDRASARDLMENAVIELEDDGYRIPVTEFQLISSTLTPKGPIYEKVSTFPLKG